MAPRVIVVITQRERMSLTERSLEPILADCSEPFDLIYEDGGSPTGIHDYLVRRSAEAGFRLIRREDWLWPNVARNMSLEFVGTPYVVFIDNDVLVGPGWLGRLVAAADETGAVRLPGIPLHAGAHGVCQKFGRTG